MPKHELLRNQNLLEFFDRIRGFKGLGFCVEGRDGRFGSRPAFGGQREGGPEWARQGGFGKRAQDVGDRRIRFEGLVGCDPCHMTIRYRFGPILPVHRYHGNVGH